MKLTEWMSSAEMGLRPITHFNERQSSPHSFLQLIWRAVADSAINWFHSFTYRASAWSPVHWLSSLTASSFFHQLIDSRKEGRSRRERNQFTLFLLSSCSIEFHDWLFGSVLSLLRSTAAAAAPNPQKKEEPNQSFHSNYARAASLRSILKENFHFSLNGLAPPPAFIVQSIYSFHS